MIRYRLLSTADFDALHECFLAAFSDYQVDMQMSPQEFAQRLARDGVSLEMSAAAFDQGRMIGFCINGIGPWREKMTAYDAGTAVVAGYRGKGVGKKLFAFLIPHLREAGVKQYLLEVLSSNVPAVSLYRKLGFVDTRMLSVFRKNEQLDSTNELPGISFRRTTKPDWPLYQSFWDAHASWQNSLAAVERIANQRTIMSAYAQDECVGYGVAFLPSANLMQLAIARAHRRRGIGSAILRELQREVTEHLKVNNIDEDLRGTLAFYETNGFKLVLRQHEMIKKL